MDLGLTQPFDLNSGRVKIGASIGGAVFPDDGAETATLIKEADDAMYEVKRTGRNGFKRWTKPSYTH